jgi:hypothetical protein
MIFGRRGILGSLAAAVSAGPAMLAEVAGKLGGGLAPPSIATVTAVATETVAGLAGDGGWKVPKGPLRALLRRASNHADRERDLATDIAERLRHGRDIDVAANASWSPAFRHHVVSMRETEERGVVWMLEDALYSHASDDE